MEMANNVNGNNNITRVESLSVAFRRRWAPNEDDEQKYVFYTCKSVSVSLRLFISFNAKVFFRKLPSLPFPERAFINVFVQLGPVRAVDMI